MARAEMDWRREAEVVGGWAVDCEVVGIVDLFDGRTWRLW